MPSTDTDLRPIPVGLARDHDPEVIAVPGIDIGPAELRGPAADAVVRWLRDGVRKVVLPDPVDLTVAGGAQAVDTVRRLVLIRELTSHGIAVDWRLRLPGEEEQEWLPYGHLRPPLELLPPPGTGGGDPAGQLADWRKAFYFDKCTYRRGPGFVQVRDRRSGRLNLITIDDPAYLAVLDQLMDGADLTTVDLDIARDFGEEGLVTKVGDLLVWLPYRLRRWPLPSMVV
ncbi:DUF5825 family protein [Polymorphospora sp. NPDC050346]|uniref:DUF5825 family protein n=1 Tax=Polymorphospora sp. NPDC050346 TaxID=3155780 RepID=UPI0033F61800